ncbi:MAG: hypothetical protein K2R93_18985 [Gemmatimonadaceae bacterium]|nr:hypothetical protein [Gemmatimonadaceae bacterium]
MTAAMTVALLAHATAHAQDAPPVAKPASATWRNPAADSLVMRAIGRRRLQLADSTLLSYTADAHGFLAFLGQLGEGTWIPPKVVQSEELALTIAWWQPGQSAQRLVGRRDTTLLPADVGYYRDRYGVVLDNLPDRIRLGDGQDVRDVPHPLAANAMSLYEYAIGRPLTITIPGRAILVDEVKFRPRNAAMAAAVGSVYLDRATGAVVRLSMTFTRAAIIDKRIETLVVTLENGLVRERYWLPRRQEVEVSRGSTWFDIPARGIVRGKWEISGYTVNERVPDATKVMPRWSSAPREELLAHKFEGRVVDVLPPEIQVATSEDVVQARVQAEAAVRAAMLARPATASVSGRGISDFGRFTRAEGLALGLGGTHKSGHGLMLSARARYGFSDQQVKGQVAIARVPAFGRVPTLQLFAERDYRELSFAERAGVTNSFAAALFGSDYSNPVDTRAAGVQWRRSPTSRLTWRLAAEEDRPVAVVAKPARGVFEPTLPAWSLKGARAEVQGTGGWVSQEPMATRGTWQLQASIGAYTGQAVDRYIVFDTLLAASYIPQRRDVRPLVGRVQGLLQVTKPLARDRALFLQTYAAAGGGRETPPQWKAFAGGPWTAPGYNYLSFASDALVSQRVEFRKPVWGPSFPLGKYGKSPPRVVLAPYAQLLMTTRGGGRVAGGYGSVGLGTLFFYDLLRADVARGLRDRTWRFTIDIDRGFWGML